MQQIPSGPALLCAGALQLQHQDGQVQGIRFHGIEVWRSVMFLYRDPVWGTPWHRSTDISIDAGTDTFHVRASGACPEVPAISWRTTISGFADHRIVYAVEVSISDDLLTSRTGICVLHPALAAGQLLEVEHVDGRVSRSRFPHWISPWQPFTQIRALRHRFAPGCWASCRFDGDDFEMEDQRNFSDASFKTYSRSNFAPRPYRLDAGTRLAQSVTLELDKVPPRRRAIQSSSNAVAVRISKEHAGRLPALGLLATVAPMPLPVVPDFWHVRFDLRRSSAFRLDRYLHCLGSGGSVGVPVRIDLLLDDDAGANAACEELAGQCRQFGLTVAEVAIFPTTARAVACARSCFPTARIGGGTAFFFTQLNRLVPPPGLDFLSYTTCPIVHVADDLSIMQSLQTLPVQIATLRQKGLQSPVHVGPAGIGMALDMFGVKARSQSDRPLAMAPEDPRDGERFGQAWILGYLCRQIEAGAAALTVAHAPAFAAVQKLAGRVGQHVLAVRNSSPERVIAIALRDGDAYCTWIANQTPESLVIDLRLPGEPSRQLGLEPYALAVNRVIFNHGERKSP